MLFLLTGLSGQTQPVHPANDCLGIQFDWRKGANAQEVAARADSDTDSLLLGIEMQRFYVAGLWGVWACVLAGSAWAAKPAAGGACMVAEFKTLALSQEDVVLRNRQAQAWLQRNVARCTPEQLSAIKGNSPMWLGTALTPELAGLFEGAIEAKIAGNPALMGQLYESLGKEGTASVSTTKNPTARAPVVQQPVVMPPPVPMVPGGMGGASVNYGNVVNQTGAQNTQQGNLQVTPPMAPPPAPLPQ